MVEDNTPTREMADEEKTDSQDMQPEQPEQRPVIANVLGVAGGAAQLIIDGMPVRNLRNVETEHNPNGTIVTVQFSPDILVQELLTEDLLQQRLAEMDKMRAEAEKQQQFVDPKEGLPN